MFKFFRWRISNPIGIIIIILWIVLTGGVIISYSSKINHPSERTDIPIKLKLESMRVEAEKYSIEKYQSLGTTSYVGFCSSTKAKELLNGIAIQGKIGFCNDSDNAWAACSPLYNDTKNWCVDSSGNSKSVPGITCDSSWNSTECP